jgi:hypothetical protein
MTNHAHVGFNHVWENAIQRHWQYWAHKMQDEDKEKNKNKAKTL